MRLLVIELLHADQLLFESTQPSLRKEGRAMLLGLLHDVSLIPETEVTVALCDSAHDDLHIAASLERLNCNQWADDLTQRTLQGFDVAFCIAPETGGLLKAVTTRLQTGIHRVICGREWMIDVGGCKKKFFDWCCQQQLPTVPTWCLSDELPDVQPKFDLWVVKPVDGCGCEKILRCPWPKIVERFLTNRDSASPFIVQPWLPGPTFSIGFVGANGEKTACLPVVEQHIRWVDDQPEYLGGAFPANLNDSQNHQLKQITEQLGEALVGLDGYVGFDLIWSTAPSLSGFRLLEWNPRLCTSYLGYRELFGESIARFWIEPGHPVPQYRKTTGDDINWDSAGCIRVG